MPYEGTYTQAMYAQQMIDEYKAAGINPRDIFAQSFDIADIRYWLKTSRKLAAKLCIWTMPIRLQNCPALPI